MLANIAPEGSQFGSFASDVQKPGTFLVELLNFVESELPTWRDREDRPDEVAETMLTSQLCAHLNSASRRANGWDILQFRVEETDAAARGRKIDLVATPSGCAIWIDGRRHTDFDALVPIECKRLPIPKDGSRDEREYVFSSASSIGGIQRFKEGHHGSACKLAAMIGYIQADDAASWIKKISNWIDGLVIAKQARWSAADHLKVEADNLSNGVTRLKSTHNRKGGLQDIDLKHLWVRMA